jgi:hypothetical protein
MASERQRKAEELYRGALELSPGDRPAFVSAACGGDVELEGAVNALLAKSKGTELRQAREHTDATPRVEEESLIGHYRVEGVLGAGGMGVVYRATDTRLDRTVALKFLSETMLDAVARRRFQREAQLASTLNHPHIVTVHDVGEHAGAQYIVTELVDGSTLADWLQAEPRAWRQIAELMIGVADALATAHEANVLHRDIKPTPSWRISAWRKTWSRHARQGARPRKQPRELERWSARSSIWRRSSSRADRSTRAATYSRSASCCTKR